MRRALAMAATALALLAGCAQPASRPAAGAAASRPAADPPEVTREAEVYTAVLRRYLSGRENSFVGWTFTTVYIMDHTEPSAPIAEATRHRVVGAFAGTQRVAFIADRLTVIDNENGCQQVKDGGILVTLGRPDGDDNDVQVHIHGFVACQGASEMTYAVHRDAATGWQVTGTVGSISVA
jgi:hypothetical protein